MFTFFYLLIAVFTASLIGTVVPHHNMNSWADEILITLFLAIVWPVVVIIMLIILVKEEI